MISEAQQEQAALYALGLLDADEAASFERELAADAGLRTLLRELRDAAALLPLAEDVQEPPPALRERVLAAVVPKPPSSSTASSPVKRIPAPRGSWLPWAIAALFLASTSVLGWFLVRQRAELTELARQDFAKAHALAVPAASSDNLAQLSFCALEPTPEFETAQPRAAVLWDAARHAGRLRINRLAPPAPGKDYQMWAVEAGRKDPVSAGVVHVNAVGQADVPFQPVDENGHPVVAVAISLEQAGGSPTNQGPILLLGKL